MKEPINANPRSKCVSQDPSGTFEATILSFTSTPTGRIALLLGPASGRSQLLLPSVAPPPLAPHAPLFAAQRRSEPGTAERARSPWHPFTASASARPPSAFERVSSCFDSSISTFRLSTLYSVEQNSRTYQRPPGRKTRVPNCALLCVAMRSIKSSTPK